MRRTVVSHYSLVHLILLLAMVAGWNLWLPPARAEWWNENLKLVGNLSNLPGNATDLKVAEERVYLRCETSYSIPSYFTTGHPYLAVIDVKNNQAPDLLDTWQPQGCMNDFDVEGTRIYAAETDYLPSGALVAPTSGVSSGNRLRIIDLSKPSDPVQLGKYKAQNTITKVKVYSKRAYLAETTRKTNIPSYTPTPSALTILDASHPDHPTFLGSFALSYPIVDMAIQGNRAFLETRDNMVYVLDISRPARPSLIKKIATRSDSPDLKKICVAGDYLYLYQAANSPRSGMCLDVLKWSLPAGQENITSYNTLQDRYPSVAAIDVQHSLVYLPLGQKGLQVIDVINPYSNDFIRGYYATPGDALAVRVYGSLIFVATGERGLTILNYTGPRRLANGR